FILGRIVTQAMSYGQAHRIRYALQAFTFLSVLPDILRPIHPSVFFRMSSFKYLRSCLLVLSFLTVNLFSAPWTNAFESDDPASRFLRTAMGLQDESDELRARFVEVALMQMIEVYLAESDLARDEANKAEAGQKLSGWVLSVNTYIEALMASAELLQSGAWVGLVFMDSGAVAALIEGKLTILAHPRAEQQSTFESNVLNTFCADGRCAFLSATAINVEPIAETQPTRSPHWLFDGRNATCQGESGSISIEYTNQINLSAMRAHCKQLFIEIRLVAAEMIQQSRHGVKLDWEVLALSAVPQSTEHLLRFNSLGDSSVLSVPFIYASGDILLDLRPWFSARVLGGPSPKVNLVGSDYGWHFSPR
ncbi:MAG: hypothetical protein V7746_19040, partial [Halioglobus sp.]